MFFCLILRSLSPKGGVTCSGLTFPRVTNERPALFAWHCVQDITAIDAVEELCGAHQADLVTFSYSLSMIPKQARCLSVVMMTKYAVVRVTG